MIDFIKKWVLKEKVLAAHCVKTLMLSIPPRVPSNDKNQRLGLVSKELGAHKSGEKQDQAEQARVSKRQTNAAVIDDLNLSKDSESQFTTDTQYAAKIAMEMGGMT